MVHPAYANVGTELQGSAHFAIKKNQELNPAGADRTEKFGLEGVGMQKR